MLWQHCLFTTKVMPIKLFEFDRRDRPSDRATDRQRERQRQREKE